MHRFLALCIVPLVLAATVVAQESQPVRAISPVYQGKVVDEKGLPVAGAIVTAREAVPDAVREMKLVDLGQQTTGADGRFRFVGKVPGAERAFMFATKEGLAMGWTNMYKNETPLSTTITLAASPTTFEGVVVDQAGQPIAGASVFPTFAPPGSDRYSGNCYGHADSGWLITRTDAAGRFKYADLPAGTTADLLASAPGYGAFKSDIFPRGDQPRYTAGQKDIRLTLPPEGRITGVVVDKATGQPLEGVTVQARSSPPQPMPLLAKSDKDGKFSFSGLAADKYLLTIAWTGGELPDWVSSITSNELERLFGGELENLATAKVQAGQSADGLRIEAVRGGLFEVTVVNAADNMPMPGACVKVGDKHASIARDVLLPQLAITNEQGQARLRLPAGEYRGAVAETADYIPVGGRPGVVTIQDGKTERLTLKVNKTPRIMCLVRDSAGQPVVGARGVPIKTPGLAISEMLTDSTGRCEALVQSYMHCRMCGGFPINPDQKLILMFRHKARGLASVETIDGFAKPFQVTHKPGLTIKGQVVGRDGTPIANAVVTLHLGGKLRGDWPPFLDEAAAMVLDGSSEGIGSSMFDELDEEDAVITDAQGRYELPAVPIGWDCDIQVRAQGYTKTIQRVSTAGKQEAMEVPRIILSEIGNRKFLPSL